MRPPLTHTAGQSGALFEINGTVANNSTWNEDIYFFSDGAGFDLTGLDFKMTFRADPTLNASDLTLSITAGTLSLQLDSNSVLSILRIAVPAADITGYTGDYTADLASQDGLDAVLLWGHGVVSFVPNPVTF